MLCVTSFHMSRDACLDLARCWGEYVGGRVVSSGGLYRGKTTCMVFYVKNGTRPPAERSPLRFIHLHQRTPARWPSLRCGVGRGAPHTPASDPEKRRPKSFQSQRISRPPGPRGDVSLCSPHCSACVFSAPDAPAPLIRKSLMEFDGADPD